MTIKKPDGLSGEKVTEPEIYFNRRSFIRAGVLAASVGATAMIYRRFASPPKARAPGSEPPLISLGPTTSPTADASPAFRTNEPPTSYEAITHYNNFYEFSTSKDAVAQVAEDFVTRPWTVRVGGLCGKPRTFDIDEILRLAPSEQRVYRMRCVEAWSMVIPWVGFPLGKLLDAVEPWSEAKYVAFSTLHNPAQMPGQREAVLEWPYVEGLRMDEAMHPLTILATGLYGRQLAPQNGAPLRLVVPWKYGFKGIKSIVKIDLVRDQPPTTWNIAAPNEYGFYANVNPEVDHPRWSQATETRIGVSGARRATLMFNGYAEQVAHLYSGMDLARYF
jgi:sulfoxide reductase catalytic subunit YedY